jgi:formylglycine-generating enzyme required for sulfatase activity
MRYLRTSSRQLVAVGALAVLTMASANVAAAQIADSSFVLIRPSTLDMGSREFGPKHLVDITRGFLVQKTEVTQAQWIAVMNSNPSVHRDCGLTCPVENVSWNDVQTFIAELNLRSPGKTYRLPTEAEWELAAATGEAGGLGPKPFQYWIAESSGGVPHPVAQLHPTSRGLYDMLGNVWEWVSDWYGPYGTLSDRDPKGPATGDQKVFKGGAFDYTAQFAAFAYRRSTDPADHVGDIGFRLVRAP